MKREQEGSECDDHKYKDINATINMSEYLYITVKVRQLYIYMNDTSISFIAYIYIITFILTNVLSVRINI